MADNLLVRTCGPPEGSEEDMQMSIEATHSQPCIGCGRATHAGTPLFSDRRSTHTGEGGTMIYLCGICNERAIDHFGRQPTDADMRQISARGAGIGYF